MSGRPVFVPKSKRQRPKKPYFHGAFTGGFSAGYFNTVGSKEGWTPREAAEHEPLEEEQQQLKHVHEEDESSGKLRKRPQQRLEDYMDEQDHNEWGGPTSVKQEYDDPATSSRKRSSVSTTLLERIVTEPPKNVGYKLLRVLGWRDGSTAYVPLVEQQQDTGDADSHAQHADATTTLEHSLLTAKKLKRIRLQQSRVRIPSPKLDLCGLGYSPHRDAPEFQRHKEQRRQKARERARAATGSGGGRNVYRMSHLLDETDEMDSSTQRRATQPQKQQHEKTGGDDDDHNVSYETMQDFVGSKSVSGFALREDDDDVYDDDAHHIGQKTSGALKVNHDEYDTVVYEHDSDVEDASDQQKGSATSDDLSGVLASWASKAGATSAGAVSSSRGLTSDGRPPLQGFVLGGISVPAKAAARSSHNGADRGIQPARFAGPDLPSDYIVKRHEFGQDEHPETFHEMSRLAQREMLLERTHAAAVEALIPNKTSDYGPKQPVMNENKRRTSQTPMAGATFAGLAAAMKDRFTSSDTSAPSLAKESSTKFRVGLHIPQATSEDLQGDTTKESEVSETTERQKKEIEISITRSTLPFVPESLLCKRFHVRVPKSSVGPAKGPPSVEKKSEAAYFDNEILTSAVAERVAKGSQTSAGTKEKPDADGTTEKDDIIPPSDQVERPPMDVFKSIFEPDSESSDSDEGSQPEEVNDSAQNELKHAENDQITEPVQKEAADLSTVHNASPNVQERLSLGRDRDEKRPRKRNRSEHQSRDEASVDISKDGDEAERRRRRRRRSRSHSLDSKSSADSSDAPRRRKQKRDRRRRDDKKKKKRKKHKSSKRI